MLKQSRILKKKLDQKYIMKWRVLEKKNDDLSRILMATECEMWRRIRNEEYSWLSISSDKKKKLYRLIDIYSNFVDIVDSVKNLKTKVEKVKLLKNTPVDSE